MLRKWGWDKWVKFISSHVRFKPSGKLFFNTLDNFLLVLVAVAIRVEDSLSLRSYSSICLLWRAILSVESAVRDFISCSWILRSSPIFIVCSFSNSLVISLKFSFTCLILESSSETCVELFSHIFSRSSHDDSRFSIVSKFEAS